MKKIKIGQLGVGHDHAPATWETLQKLSDLFDVVGYAVPENDTFHYEETKKVYENGNRMTPDELLNTPGLDAVAIETNELESTKYALAAAARGISIHLDKPGGVSNAEFEELCRKAKQKNIAFHMGYMYRYNPEIMRLYRRIENNELGDILSVEAHMDCEHPTEKRQWLAQFPGGMMFFLGCHLVDLIYHIQGLPEQLLPLNSASHMGGTSSLDQGFTVFRYPHGMSFAHTFADEAAGYMRRQLVVTGTKGSVVLQPLEGFNDDGSMYTGIREASLGHLWNYDGERKKSASFDRYENMFRAFASYVRKEATNPYTLEYECTLHRLVLASCGEDVNYKEKIIL